VRWDGWALSGVIAGASRKKRANCGRHIVSRNILGTIETCPAEEEAPPSFREKLASLETDPRRKREGPLVP
jgi:hypothetical protein